MCVDGATISRYRCVVNELSSRSTRVVASPTMAVSEPVARPLTAHDPRIAPWRAFLLAHARVSRRLDEELRAEHDLSFAEYDALLTIAQAPGPADPDGPARRRGRCSARAA